MRDTTITRARMLRVHRAAGRTTITAVEVVQVSTLGCCDLCAQHGVTAPATSEARLAGGQWASLCDAHAYRARSVGHVVEGAEGARRAA